MTKKEKAILSLNKKLLKRDKQFDKLWSYIVDDINTFIEKNGVLDNHTVDTKLQNLDKITDSMCLSGAWMQDRLKGYTSWSGNNYSRSLSKK